MHSFHVYPSSSLSVIEGVAVGEPISYADDLTIDDSYELGVLARTAKLEMQAVQGVKSFRISESSQIGSPGNLIHLDSHVTFMSELGATHEALLFVEVDGDFVVDVYVLPLAAMQPKEKYQLISVDRARATKRLGELANVSFAKGTHITISTGEQRLIEDLKVGDKVLTRDHGPQPVRWIGHTTLRASGVYAPVVISAGELHNLNDLVVSPEVCLFIYQRNDALGAGRSEVMLRSSQLVNGRTIYRRYGGYIDYFQILLDDHYVIYVEGIATESFRVDENTLAVVPPKVAEKLAPFVHSKSGTRYNEYLVRENLITDADTVKLLRKASYG